MIAVGAAHENRAVLTESAVTRYLDAAELLQDLGKCALSAFGDVLRRDDADGVERVGLLLRNTRCRHYCFASGKKRGFVL